MAYSVDELWSRIRSDTRRNLDTPSAGTSTDSGNLLDRCGAPTDGCLAPRYDACGHIEVAVLSGVFGSIA